MRIYDVIKKKRGGGELTPEEIGFFIKGLGSGEVADYTASALLMAICINGMTSAETAELTRAMAASGAPINTSGINKVKVDKHSTGGVGDKTSIVLAPLAASMGICVPMLSGRGLAHTGGTLDKLESIPGMNTAPSRGEALRQLRELGLFIIGAGGDIAPADAALYRLRDMTATVDSIPLIAASIMSKKLSESIDGLVLDVKTGAGAFMQSMDDARQLGASMVEIGNSLGVTTVAMITDMDQPLGRTVGNALELKECITAMKGRGADDIMQLILNLGAWMLNLTDAISEEVKPVAISSFILKKYKDECMEFLERGDVLKKFAEMVDAQGGDAEAVLNPSMLPRASQVTEVKAPADGYVRKLNARLVGEACSLLGAGRLRAGDTIDPAAGIVLNAKVGDKVSAGQAVALMHHNESANLGQATEAFMEALVIGERDTAQRPLIHEVIME